MTEDFSGFNAFFSIFEGLKKKHLFAFLYDVLFLFLGGIALYFVGKLQMQLAEKVYGTNLLGQVAHVQSASLDAVSEAKGTLFAIIGVFIFLILIIVYCWSFTRTLIWSTLLGKKIKNLAKFSLKLSAINLVWLLLSVVPFYFVLFRLARIYNDPLFAITSRASGYTYILFLQLIMLLIVLLYCHFTNIFYYKYLHAPKLKTIWHALKFGVVNIPAFLKPMGVLMLFFVVLMFAGIINKFLPELMASILSFGIVFFFALISRQFYINILKHYKH